MAARGSNRRKSKRGNHRPSAHETPGAGRGPLNLDGRPGLSAALMKARRERLGMTLESAADDTATPVMFEPEQASSQETRTAQDARRRPGVAAVVLGALAKHRPQFFTELQTAVEQVPDWRTDRSSRVWGAVATVVAEHGLEIQDVRADWLTPALWGLVHKRRRDASRSLLDLAIAPSLAAASRRPGRGDRHPIAPPSAEAFVRWYVNRERLEEIGVERRHMQDIRRDLGLPPHPPGRPRKTRTQSR
jgi:hypothetical protein